MHGTAIDFTLPITNHTWIFFLVLCIILFAPLILNKLRIPHIIGMILAGVVIGEHGLNILSYDSSFELFGQVGLLYIMFLAGLELDMDGMMKNRSKGLIFGLLTFFIPFFMTLFGSMWLIHYDFWTSTLVAAIFGTHTLLTYTIVGRYGQTKHPSVIIAIGGTVVSLFLSLIVLAEVASHFSPDSGVIYWLVFLGKFLLYIAFVFWCFPKMTKWFFARYDDSILQYIFILGLLFLSSALAEGIGMEGIFGAFMAGLIINPLIPHLSPLMNRIEFVGNALFIPYFLIGVGMITNLRLLFGDLDSLWVIFVLIAIATSSKWIAAFVGQKIFKLNRAGRTMLFGMTNAHAACALAMLLVGTHIYLPNGQPLIGDEVLNPMIILILVSSLISSLATERAARNLALNQGDDKEMKQIKEEEQILISYSNPNTVEQLTQMALLLHQPKKGKQLIGLHVTSEESKDPGKRMRAKQGLETAVKIAAAVDVPMMSLNRVSTNVASGIIHTVTEHDATDLLIGLHQKTKMTDKFWGNLTNNLLQRMHRQVIVVRCNQPTNNLKAIKVAVLEKAEFESGFTKWIDRICNISEQLNAKITFHTNNTTEASIKKYIQYQHPNQKVKFESLVNVHEFQRLHQNIHRDELMVFVSARKTAISYQSEMERIPLFIDQYFSHCSLLIIYPDQYGVPERSMSFIDPLHALSNQTAHLGVEKWFPIQRNNTQEK